MSRLFAFVLLLTILVGFYWTVGSGTYADRSIHMHLQRAASGGTAEQIQSHMDSIKAQVLAQRQWTERLRFIARNPDMSRIDNASSVVDEVLLALQQSGAGPAAGSEGGDQVEQLAQELRSVHISVGFFRPGEQRVWTIVFWLLAVAAGITGLLSFVRSSAGF